jgi:hypothetical protein
MHRPAGRVRLVASMPEPRDGARTACERGRINANAGSVLGWGREDVESGMDEERQRRRLKAYALDSGTGNIMPRDIRVRYRTVQDGYPR